MHPFRMAARAGLETPKLFIACATGQHIPVAVVTEMRTDPSGKMYDYFLWKMTDVMVSAFDMATGVDGTNTTTIETFSLDYARIELEYRPSMTGAAPVKPVTGGFDKKANKPI